MLSICKAPFCLCLHCRFPGSRPRGKSACSVASLVSRESSRRNPCHQKYVAQEEQRHRAAIRPGVASRNERINRASDAAGAEMCGSSPLSFLRRRPLDHLWTAAGRWAFWFSYLVSRFQNRTRFLHSLNYQKGAADRSPPRRNGIGMDSKSCVLPPSLGTGSAALDGTWRFQTE